MQGIISNLFFDYQQTDEYAKEFDNMSRKEDVQAAQDTFVEPLSKEDFEKDNAADNILAGALTAMADFGFEQGFKYAMRLRDECSNIGGNL